MTTVFRVSQDLKGKELSAHTLASFMVAHGVTRLRDIQAGRSMNAQMLTFINRPRAIRYWENNGWLEPLDDDLALTAAGAEKIARRLNGQDGSYNVTEADVLYWFDIISQGSPNLETISGTF